MTAESFSKIMAGIQSAAVVIGLMIGGWWSLRTFIFQNPAFYEQGLEAAGVDPNALKLSIEIKKLNVNERSYEVILTIVNSSKTLSQLIRGEEIVLFYAHPDQSPAMRAAYISKLHENGGITIPSMEARDLHFVVRFPDDGIYLLEADPCKIYGGGCLAQEYVFINAQNR